MLRSTVCAPQRKQGIGNKCICYFIRCFSADIMNSALSYFCPVSVVSVRLPWAFIRWHAADILISALFSDLPFLLSVFESRLVRFSIHDASRIRRKSTKSQASKKFTFFAFQESNLSSHQPSMLASSWDPQSYRTTGWTSLLQTGRWQRATSLRRRSGLGWVIHSCFLTWIPIKVFSWICTFRKSILEGHQVRSHSCCGWGLRVFHVTGRLAFRIFFSKLVFLLQRFFPSSHCQRKIAELSELH